jgi:hypothetical protein
MRGGVTVNELMHIFSYEDRVVYYDIIKENIETTKETGLPLV